MLHHAPVPSRPLIDDLTYADQDQMLPLLVKTAALSATDRQAIVRTAADLVRRIRGRDKPGLMEVFLAEYGLSTDEGVALMCLAEALLRVPDTATIDALIEDKIAPSDWGQHLGHSSSPLVNASTWALMLTGKVLDEDTPGPAGHLRGALKRLGEPVIRRAVSRAMKEMGAQFVLGETIEAAMTRAARQEAKGYTYSYDMLGEAARTARDADRYFRDYSAAIARISKGSTGDDLRAAPGISVKLSALYPRYEEAKQPEVIAHLVPRLQALCLQAKAGGIGLNVDAEEADRLALSLDVIEAVARSPACAGWDGLGVVVQAYGPRTGAVIDWLYGLAQALDRRFMVRLVKGAYWDTEIKRAQVAGLAGFPVYTTKSVTDVSYIANARKLLGYTDRLYPQFATHNAHTAAAILHMADDLTRFEFQRLHGMGEALHDILHSTKGTRCRIYAPVGAHRDLLAYLVRRLLENGANSSFVNQIVDLDVPPEDVVSDPFSAVPGAAPARGTDLFAPERPNSRGWDLAHRPGRQVLEVARDAFRRTHWQAAPILAEAVPEGANTDSLRNPARPDDVVGQVHWATSGDAARAIALARPWDASPEARRKALTDAAHLFEDHHAEIFALLAREAGKTLPDAVAELREAVDFLRYYAARAYATPPRGVFACISPWNFPLAIFTGQIAAALAAGNAVLAKPAEQTPLIAALAVRLLHRAGIPRDALQLLPGAGDIGQVLTSTPGVDGVAFTGGTETAQAIHRAVANHLAPGTPLIAETGGLNAMVVDSTALPEQVVQAVIESAFQSAGQRCSALRCLYLQEDIAEPVLAMLTGAMAELRPGDPWDLATDLGPVIDADAKRAILDYLEQARAGGRLIAQTPVPEAGHFVPPSLIRVPGISAMTHEVFGPVLHIATFRACDLARVIADINATGYGLTFGLQTRMDDRVQEVVEQVHAGNIYVNRNQIGAIVGSQPFGGEGLSGTGPKAGGPNYLPRFQRPAPATVPPGTWDMPQNPDELQQAVTRAAPGTPRTETALPGPTGESNRYSTQARPPVLCLGPGAGAAQAQARAVQALGGRAVQTQGAVTPEMLTDLQGIAGAIWWGDATQARALRRALAARQGPLLPLITALPDQAHVRSERHVCIDTTAAGGNVALLSTMS